MDGSDSRVMKTGGLGLFLEPGGRPRGRRMASIVAPSLLLASLLAVVFGVVGLWWWWSAWSEVVS